MTAPSRAAREVRRTTVPAEAKAATELDVKPLAQMPIEVPMDDDAEKDLVSYLASELGDHLGTRSAFITHLLNMQEMYRAPKATTEKNFPFKRASQITMPIGKMTVNVIAPRIIDEWLRADPIWSVRSSHKASALERVANEGEDFLKLYANRRMNVESKIETMALEGTKLGTHVFEVVMDQLHRHSARYSDDGTEIVKVTEPVSVGPQWRPIPLQDFVWKFGFTDLQEMPWCGKLLHLVERQLKDRVTSGKWRATAIEEVLKHPSSTGFSQSTDLVSQAHEKYEHAEVGLRTPGIFDVYSLHLFWPIKVEDEKGKKVEVTADLLVDFSLEARKVLSVRLNPYWHRKRPLFGWAYSPVEYRFNGEGIPEQVEQFQDEITAMHRLRLDNQTLSGMRMIVVSKMVEGLSPGDPLYPGKVIKAPSATDIQPFQLADVYPSTVLNENLSMAFVERVTGINEATLGRAMPVTRTTATAQVSLLEEQSKRFNMVIRRGRRVIGQAGEMVYDLFHQFGTNGLAVEWMGPTRGRVVELLFSLPREKVIAGFSIGVVATSPKVNKQLDMQANLQLFNLMVSLHQQLIQLVQLFGPQAQQILPLIVRPLVTSAKRFMIRVLDSFDETDPEGVLLALTLLERILPDPTKQMGVDLDEESLKEAAMALRPEIAAAAEEGIRVGMQDTLASAQVLTDRGGNGGQTGATAGQGAMVAAR